MIGRITGTLLEKSPPTICVDTGGVGYDIDVPMSTLYNLPDVGAKVTLYTHLSIREDAHVLFGFGTPAERATFRQLVKVTGIGARTALGILSGLSVEELSQAVTLQETARLTRVPGIGKKTAERLLLELKGKLGADLGHVQGSTAPSNQSDILNALLALGYSERESLAALKKLPADVDVSSGIKLALQGLVR
ncbi:Holliday junction branch migration protein RuvA [Kerstersia gyiorum]|jgi:Holliday junction DNA helicase RuvA|uniref:Holliday junction branch migration complex subunit RuvA n=1 Tax=Kerstersia gyiorum TaxID=206506 RepID=A0A171KNH5_9BURK|nr:Holliday junction branch migration protein RuvA [Kerstersia gyiorum]AZV92850.1 Holliday junction branch migration protein RuvA [Bordetella sp. J329]MCO7641281.1 Holliday junction branch migration protein RuvA [Pseudomonas sp. S 311-6]KKO70442.1 ATP-dependent DNA helicase RuvA [Kerstersia gyiorum]MCH4271078.1 Holliday junction branch migration protein RuvA [Kerstersia gyiorum]MCI1227873.1 Holliday junction branch migration protein RuvA [Kerstersia gyiorum]